MEFKFMKEIIMFNYNVIKKLILFIIILITVISCSNNAVQESEYKRLEIKIAELEEQNILLSDAIKYNREYVIELEAEYTFNISENKRKIIELEKLIASK